MKEKEPRPYTAKEKAEAEKAKIKREWLEDRKTERDAQKNLRRKK